MPGETGSPAGPPGSVRVKICGITGEADLRTAADAGADAVGLISEVSVETPREVDPGRAAELARAAPPFVSTVLVTMARTTGRIAELVDRVRPDAVQVHADLAPRRVRRLRSDLDATVVVAVDAADRAALDRYDGVADAVLVDSLSPSGAGGTGRTADWERTRAVVADADSPVVLAGGLDPDNVAEAVRTVRPYGVDVASGVERRGGVKDDGAVRAFVASARAAAGPAGTDPGEVEG